MEKEKDGVWRTIRGRRIFIGKGESLGEAMTKSGKFKREDIRKGKSEAFSQDYTNKMSGKYSLGKMKKLEKSRRKTLTNYDDSKQAEKNRLNDYAINWKENGGVPLKETGLKFKVNSRVEANLDKYSDKDRREIAHENLQKKLKEYKDYKEAKADLPRLKRQRESMLNAMSNNREGLGTNYWGDKYKEASNYVKDTEQKIADYKAKKQSNNKQETWEEKVKRLEKENAKNKNYEIPEQSNNKVETEKELYERAKNKPDSIDPMTENSTDWEALEKKYGKTEPSGLNTKEDYEHDLKWFEEMEEKYPTKGGLKNNEDYQALKEQYESEFNTKWKSSKEKNKTIKDSVRKSTKKDEKDWLPKATEIKEQGKSNRKEVSDNIQAHILEHYGPDYTGDDSISAEQAFIDQMDTMSWLPNNWKRGEEIAKGGSYLVYNQDMADFLDSLKINPKGKKFDSNKSFDTYVSLIGRESAKLYDRIKKHQAETINNYKKKKSTNKLTKETKTPRTTPQERVRASVYATGNKWAIENYNATHN